MTILVVTFRDHGEETVEVFQATENPDKDAIRISAEFAKRQPKILITDVSDYLVRNLTQ